MLNNDNNIDEAPKKKWLLQSFIHQAFKVKVVERRKNPQINKGHQ